MSFNANVIGGALNLRQSCSTGSTRVTQIPNGSAVTVTLVNGEPEWFAVSYNNYNGFALARYIAVTNDGGTATVTTASGSLNIRKTPSSSASVLYQAPQNSELRLLDSTSVNGWYRVSGLSGTGWAMSQFLTITSYPEGESDTPFTPLSSGMQGDAVGELQEKLLSRRYYFGHSDYVFDSRTEWAVKYFQFKNNLTATGIVDQQTMNLLNFANTGGSVIEGVDDDVCYRSIGGPAVTDMHMGDDLWCNVAFDADNTTAVETIGNSGNAPTAIAIAYSTLWGVAITPPVIAEWAKYNNERDENGVTGVKSTFFNHVAAEWDVRYAGTVNNLDSIIAYLALGGLCVVRITGSSEHGFCSANGATYVVVYKVDSNNVYFVNSNGTSGNSIPVSTWRAASWVREAHRYGVALSD